MISQPRYLPSPSYLQRIAKADVFVIYDTCQRVERGFENRNKLYDGKWLTIPIASSRREIIKNTEIAGFEWKEKHIAKIQALYEMDAMNPVVKEYYDTFNTTHYRDALTGSLKYLLDKYNINTKVVFASELDGTINGGINQLLRLTKLAGCTTYLSGASCLQYGLSHPYAKSQGVNLEIDRVTEVQYGFLHYVMHSEKFL
jgi:hypothetical protein